MFSGGDWSCGVSWGRGITVPEWELGLGGLSPTRWPRVPLPAPPPTGSPARWPGLVPGPLALAPGPAADGFLFLPVSLEQAPASLPTLPPQAPV